MSEPIDVERADAVARITMNRPDHHNSLNRRMADDLVGAVVDLVEDDGVRCLVLTGTEGVFCTGADLTSLAGDASDRRLLRELATKGQIVARHLAQAPKPVVVGVNGVAAGAGFGLALAGDLVVVHEDARFEYAYPAIGLSGDAGATYFLPRLVGLRRALSITLRNEPIPAEEAVEIGLATELAGEEEFDDRLAEIAADLADGPTRAHATIKRLLRQSRGRGLGTHLDAETDAIVRLAGTDDFAAGYEAFFAGEQPTFRGE